MGHFAAAGYDVGERFDAGWAGELWSATSHATGRAVVLRRLLVADDRSTRDRLRRAAAALVALEHPHLVGVIGVLGTEDSLVLVLEPAAAVSLADLLAVRGHLDAAETVTLTAPLADALAAAHERGVVHGRIGSEAVLLGTDGRPVLDQVGLAALLDVAGSAPGRPSSRDPADDVRDLATLALATLAPAALAGGPAGAPAGAMSSGPGGAGLVAALRAATARDAAARPTARELAASVLASGPAAPIRRAAGQPLESSSGGLRRPGPATAQRRGGGHRASRAAPPNGRSRHWNTALLAAAALVVAALTGRAWAGADSGTAPAAVRPPPPARPTTASPTTASPTTASPTTASPPPARPPTASPSAPVRGSWRAVLSRLDAGRAAAFATGSTRPLDGVYATGSPALARDRERVAALVTAGARVHELRLRTTSVRVRARARDLVVLEVTDVLAPYEVRGTDGGQAQRRPGRGPVRWTVTLRKEEGRWQVYDVAGP